MATPAEDAATTYANITATLALVSASLLPDYTLPGGASIKRIEYYKFLLEAQKSAREAMLAAAGPWEIVSVAR